MEDPKVHSDKLCHCIPYINSSTFGYAPNYLGTLLAKTTGQSFTEIRQKACINCHNNACKQHTPIGEIAQSVGISNVTFFYTLFHRFFDMTPAEYRAKYRSAQ